MPTAFRFTSAHPSSATARHATITNRPALDNPLSPMPIRQLPAKARSTGDSAHDIMPRPGGSLRSLALTLVAAATFLPQAPAYRTLDDRFAPPDAATRQAWTARAGYVREHVLASAGLLPMPERTPLNPVVFGEVRHADYVVSKVYFESLPGFFVTGN